MWSLSGVFDKNFGVVTRVLVEWPRSRNSIRGGDKELFSKTSRLAMGQIQPSVLWLPGIFSTRVQQQGREADISLPLVSRLSYVTTSTFPYVLLAWCLWSAPLRYNRTWCLYAHTKSVFLWKQRAGNKHVLRVQCFTDIINNDTRHKTFGSNTMLSWRHIPPPTLAVPSLPVRCVGCYTPLARWMTEQNSMCVTV
jgi:hypothetical protein